MEEYIVCVKNIECGIWNRLGSFSSCGVATAYTLSKMDKLNNPMLRMKIIQRKKIWDYNDGDKIVEKVVFEQRFPHGNAFKWE